MCQLIQDVSLSLVTLSLREKLRKIGLPQNADGCDFWMTEMIQSRC